MSAEQPVPFLAINVCLREDFLQRVLARALEALAHASGPCRATLAKELAVLQIPGFRQFQRAPRALQARAAIARFRESGDVAGCVLEIWTDTHTELLPAMEAFLKARGFASHRLRAEDRQFREQWSMDEVLRLADEFRTEHPDADRDDVALLLCCLTSRAPILPDPAQEAPAPAEDAAPALAAAPGAAPPPSSRQSNVQKSSPPARDGKAKSETPSRKRRLKTS